ncbi:MAG: hypothetical protein JXQ73_10350 [Phycisphaerae bacterium]|nr:hypothetical protein [Phycisphaerae bacterium]
MPSESRRQYYEGRYEIFDPSAIQTYPLSTRPNKVKLEDLVDPAKVLETDYRHSEEQASLIEEVAGVVTDARRAGHPVVVITGAHLIKNGLGPLLVDLVRRGVVTLVATNGAGAIHDFELALVGETSEHVPNALPGGKFGMAYEFAYYNEALNLGHEMHLGYGESLGRMIRDASFRQRVLDRVGREDSPTGFTHPETSVLAMTYDRGVPMTVHASIGTDVVDQHPNFDPSAKGGTSGTDFLIFTRHMATFTEGGVVLNIGSAVTGPEVLLKAVSMVGNVGKPPKALTTADFDLRPHDPAVMSDESAAGYYYRDQKSIVTRIPQAFGGRGYYVQGDQRTTVPVLYQAVMRHLT